MDNGKLTVADGGEVTASSLTVGYQLSYVAFGVSGNNLLVLGNGTSGGSLCNFSTINFYADSYLASGTYSPISAYSGQTMIWSGPGSYNAYGGTWDNVAHTFIATVPKPSAASVSSPISTGERLLFTDSGSGQQVGASFGSVGGGTTFSASLMSPSELNGLTPLIGSTGQVLAGWDFSTNFSGDQVLLSYYIGQGQPQNLEVWHYSNGAWNLYAPDLMTYGSDGVVSFTVDSFSGYAVTTPEPTTLALLALGGLGVLGKVARRRRT